MLICQKDFPLSFYEKNILDRLGEPAPDSSGHPVFMDIETTGLSSSRNMIYLTGICFPDENGWHFRQWMCEKRTEEPELLQEVLQALSDASELIHFNGNRFDLPFLETRCIKYDLPTDPLYTPGRDLLRLLCRAKSLLPLPNMKLKTWEQFLGIAREDRCSGGELINVWKQYTKSHDPESERLLLLHNEEDILNLPRLLPALAYTDLAKGHLSVTGMQVEEDPADADASSCTVLLTTDLPLPQPILLTAENTRLYLKDRQIRLTTTVFDGERKLYYPDPKNYFYLPVEDMAVHKSVGAFVDKNYREPATAATAYSRHTGRFLPGFPGLPDTRLFYEDNQKKAAPWLLADGLTDRPLTWWTAYLRETLAAV